MYASQGKTVKALSSFFSLIFVTIYVSLPENGLKGS
jgi:hypothetical protein